MHLDWLIILGLHPHKGSSAAGKGPNFTVIERGPICFGRRRHRLEFKAAPVAG